jgi:ABC-type antimicrobial peptide transport system permease subunit
VVRDVRHQDLRTPTPPTLFVPIAQASSGTAYFTVRTDGDPAAIVPAVRNVVRAIDQNLPLAGVRTQDEVFEVNLLSTERFFARLSVFLGLLALALACVGLYGLMSYAVVRRTGEIGVRMALGARPVQILRMILRESVALVTLGLLLGIGAAYAGTRLISSLLYGVSPTDPPTYASMAGFLMVIAVLACLLPARRATKVDPMVALRAE